MKRIALIALAVLVAVPVVGAVGYWQYVVWIGNPRVERELIENPNGERAARVMLLTLPSGRRIPVNYLIQEGYVYAAADGNWWEELVGNGVAVGLLVRGQEMTGTARAIQDDPAYTKRIFAELRPNAIEGFGVLIEIRLAALSY